LTSAAPHPGQGCSNGQPSAYELLTPEENEAREGKKPVIGKRYFAGTLEEMIMDYHLKQMSIAEEKKGLVPFPSFVVLGPFFSNPTTLL
jgi:dual specificity protein kinase YAK1